MDIIELLSFKNRVQIKISLLDSKYSDAQTSAQLCVVHTYIK